MATWQEVSAAAPDLAAAVQTCFDAHRHKMLATLRRDGSPRLSGIEARFSDGELWLGMMPDSRKALDLRRDPRLALHSATVDPEMVAGDAKLAGRASEVTDPETIARFTGAVVASGDPEPPTPFHLFRVDIMEVVLTRIGDPPDHLLIESWRPGEGYQRVDRY